MDLLKTDCDDDLQSELSEIQKNAIEQYQKIEALPHTTQIFISDELALFLITSLLKQIRN